MDRNTMRGLKEKKDEALRIQKVNDCVRNIYEQAVRVAESTTHTTYSFDINPHQRQHMRYGDNHIDAQYGFYKDNMTEILINLWSLFPECTIKLAKMCIGNDGKRYDISTMDEKMLPFINQKPTFECIVVDWS